MTAAVTSFLPTTAATFVMDLPELMADTTTTTRTTRTTRTTTTTSTTKPQHHQSSKSSKQVRFDDTVDVSVFSSENSIDCNIEFWYTSEELTCIRRSLVDDLSHYRRFISESRDNTMIDETQYCVRGVEHHLCKDVVFEKRRKVRTAIEGTLATQHHLKTAGIDDPTLFLQSIYSISASWASDDARVRGSADAADAIKIYLELAAESDLHTHSNSTTTTEKHTLEEDDSHSPQNKRRRTC
eukprot:CAMPEP_0195283142 /NCGR_PEP_ID=MMETSP0707-20130614/1787_1 /TAXON_ID=33640 /ORGANISM="Asterionellopsis glacialis, Strain CCMP134" /LENGTH=239 /DNA_ID=CAMNT_0040342261 /DNA_START=63 /DNA_END=782 /DNA_ORIENTATION=-